MTTQDSPNADTLDFLVIGGGIAGASAAYFLSPHGSTLVLEAESQPGYHSTGRSAAQYIPSYGSPQVRALTLTSRAFLDAPPEGFCDTALLSPRSVLSLAMQGQVDLLEQAWATLQSVNGKGRRLSPAEATQVVPALRAESICGAVLEEDSFDIDVHALHQGYLRGLKSRGGAIATHARVDRIERDGDGWHVCAGEQSWRARILINAAGAWADELARMAGLKPLGLTPKRRSAFMLNAPQAHDISDWPLVYAADESFYFKPDTPAQLMVSPSNADPTVPQDIQPEELDIAMAMAQINQHTTLTGRPQHAWAGLRTFAPDGGLVAGFSAEAPNFFWCAGQGGYGIQTSPAMGLACASLITKQAWPASLSEFGLSPEMLSPQRPGLHAD